MQSEHVTEKIPVKVPLDNEKEPASTIPLKEINGHDQDKKEPLKDEQNNSLGETSTDKKATSTRSEDALHAEEVESLITAKDEDVTPIV